MLRLLCVERSLGMACGSCTASVCALHWFNIHTCYILVNTSTRTTPRTFLASQGVFEECSLLTYAAGFDTAVMLTA
jgi:hypothetical protein